MIVGGGIKVKLCRGVTSIINIWICEKILDRPIGGVIVIFLFILGYVAWVLP